MKARDTTLDEFILRHGIPPLLHFCRYVHVDVGLETFGIFPVVGVPDSAQATIRWSSCLDSFKRREKNSILHNRARSRVVFMNALLPVRDHVRRLHLTYDICNV